MSISPPCRWSGEWLPRILLNSAIGSHSATGMNRVCLPLYIKRMWWMNKMVSTCLEWETIAQRMTHFYVLMHRVQPYSLRIVFSDHQQQWSITSTHGIAYSCYSEVVRKITTPNHSHKIIRIVQTSFEVPNWVANCSIKLLYPSQKPIVESLVCPACSLFGGVGTNETCQIAPVNLLRSDRSI